MEGPAVSCGARVPTFVAGARLAGLAIGRNGFLGPPGVRTTAYAQDARTLIRGRTGIRVFCPHAPER